MGKKNNFNSNIYEKNTTFDLPINYNELLIYPVKMIDYFDFHMYKECLLFDQHNDSRMADDDFDYSILKLKYLDYLYNLTTYSGEPIILFMLFNLLRICLKIEDMEQSIQIRFDEKKSLQLLINGITITAKDFEQIRKIICFQNNIDIEIFDFAPDVRRELNKAKSIKQKMANNIACLEDQIISVFGSNYDEEKVRNMSIRKFNILLERTDLKMTYEIYTTASMSGFVKFKKSIPHWLDKIDKNISKDVISLEEAEKKLK